MLREEQSIIIMKSFAKRQLRIALNIKKIKKKSEIKKNKKHYNN
jgi:hypothetical protein